jgi:hypothetical protein
LKCSCGTQYNTGCAYDLFRSGTQTFFSIDILTEFLPFFCKGVTFDVFIESIQARYDRRRNNSTLTKQLFTTSWWQFLRYCYHHFPAVVVFIKSCIFRHQFGQLELDSAFECHDCAKNNYTETVYIVDGTQFSMKQEWQHLQQQFEVKDMEPKTKRYGRSPTIVIIFSSHLLRFRSFKQLVCISDTTGRKLLYDLCANRLDVRLELMLFFAAVYFLSPCLSLPCYSCLFL